jgi:hypothetical protein
MKGMIMTEENTRSPAIVKGWEQLGRLRIANTNKTEGIYMSPVRKCMANCADSYERLLVQADGNSWRKELDAEVTPEDALYIIELLMQRDRLVSGEDNWLNGILLAIVNQQIAVFNQANADYMEELRMQQADMLWQLTGGDSEIDSQTIWKQLNPINDLIGLGEFNTETPEGLIRLLETAFDYDIRLTRSDFDLANEEDVNQLMELLMNVGTSNAHITDYFEESLATTNLDENALVMFRQIFGHNPDGTQIVVYLGANKYTDEDNPDQGAYRGYVPLPPKDDSNSLHSMYLGSNVSVATITHEFGHQMDRWFRLSEVGGIPNYLRGESRFVAGSGGDLSLGDTYQNAITGFAGKEPLDAEIWGDLFMTAVLHGKTDTSGNPYQVWSVKDDYVSQFEESDGEWDCNATTCGNRDIAWDEDYSELLGTYFAYTLFPELFDFAFEQSN